MQRLGRSKLFVDFGSFYAGDEKNKTKQNKKNTWCNFLSLVSSTMSKHIFIKKERSKPNQSFSKVFPTLFGVPYNELLFRAQAPSTDCLPSLF